MMPAERCPPTAMRENRLPADTSKNTLARAATDPGWLRWAVFAGCGIVLGVAGLAGRAPDGGATVRLVAHVPDPLIALALASGALAALLVLSLLLPRGIRRRRKEDEEYEFYHEPQKISAWAMLLLWVLVLSPFVAAGYLLWHGFTSFGEGGVPLSLHQQGVSTSPRPFSPPGHAPAASPSLWTAAVTALALCASLGSLGLLLWIFVGDRLARWWAGPLPLRRSEALADAVEESLEDLAREPDARVAIIKCYRRFEQALARSRVPRAPWQTPTEFMRAALGRLALPARAVQRLTQLFEVARFSVDPLALGDRAAACESLDAIRASLEQEKTDDRAA
jgi:hypothetical protein